MGIKVRMAGPPPRDPNDPLDPQDPREPVEDETIIVPPAEETVVADEWEPEAGTYVEQAETVPPRRPMPKIWPGLLALLLLVLAGLGGAYLLSRDDDDEAAQTTTAATTTAQSVSIPDVVGTSSSEATATLTSAGLDVNLVPVPSDAPVGQVVAQSPAAGNDVAEGSTVRLNVAEERPAPPATTTDDETTGTSATTTATTTAATTTAATTTTAPQPATVPDAVGQELAEAGRSFAAQGLKASVRYVPSSEAAGRVVAQAQPAGTELKRGDTVQLNVSTGADPAAAAAVPDVVGQKNEDARRALEAAGFEVLALSVQGSQVRNESPVASQSPAADASIPGGSLVLLYV